MKIIKIVKFIAWLFCNIKKYLNSDKIPNNPKVNAIIMIKEKDIGSAISNLFTPCIIIKNDNIKK